MNDSKIGTWLMRDGGTAVVIHNNGENTFYRRLIGFHLNSRDGYWLPVSWNVNGRHVASNQDSDIDLIRKVSDSTELKPWKPVKKWRPWTWDEATGYARCGMWFYRKGNSKLVNRPFGYDADAGKIGFNTFGWITPEVLLSDFLQHDGTPCGVEVEE